MRNDKKRRQRQGRDPAHEKTGKQYHFVCAGVLVTKNWHCHVSRNLVTAFIPSYIRRMFDDWLANQKSQKRLVVRK
ncbi:hypothetical protein [Enterococcus pallens]|uniref:Uncharacterized protein n=1 Tax=Enterococcus pallens ATCC BAA-351 TaxID=1158607 RepID=R2QB77_9ENTE|nr:hypothetical protein [Enterococcus pallens]EOH93697.1 hypothetical protein UAU_02393 [Enterococcus pallens ATCC BAA-351]EOU24537.1 hypothetical protein I588_00524 [Enterococcus pallens ATCC BAA-351]